MKILRFLLNRPVGTIMLWTGLILGGIWATFNIRTDFLPDFTIPKLTVISTYQGLPAEEIRRLITIPLEDSLSSIGGLKNIKSISRDGLSLIELEFPWGTDRTKAGLETRGLIDLAWQNLPSDAAKPRVLSIDPGDLPIMTLAVFPKNGSLSLARRISDRELRSRLQRIEGVGSIQLTGGLIDEVEIEVDPERLASLGYTIPVISSAIGEANIDYPAGTIIEGNTEYLVKTRSRAETISELGGLYLPRPQSYSAPSPVRLTDIAFIRMGEKEQSSIFFSKLEIPEKNNSREGVRLIIRRTAGYSPAALATNLLNELDGIKRSFERDLDIVIIADRSESLKRSIRDLAFSLLSGAIFAFAIIIVFLRNLPRALLLLISLPASLLFSVLLLFLAGKSLNLMSLGGLALGVGMVVDNAIVVTERLSRLNLKISAPVNRIESIAAAVSSLAPSLAGSTITSVIVFTPLLFIKGLIGSLFADLGLSVIISLSSSLIISMSFIPVLYLKLNPKDTLKTVRKQFAPGILRLVRTGIRHPVAVSFIVLSVCAAAFIPLRILSLELITPINEGVINCSLKLAPGTSMQSVKKLTKELVTGAAALPSVISVNACAGGESSNPYYLASTEESSETILIEIYHSKTADRDLIRSEMTDMINEGIGTLEMLPQQDILASLIGIEQNTDWVIKGEHPETVRDSAEELLEEIGGAHMIPGEHKTRILVYPDRKALISLGIELAELSDHIGQSIYGTIPANMLISGEETDIRLRLKEEDRSDREDIMGMKVPGSGSTPVRLSSIVSIRDKEALPYLLREGRKDLAVIRLDSTADRNTVNLLKSRGAEPREVPVLVSQLPQLLRTFALAVILLYLCLGIQFESLSLPLFLMLGIPAGASGIITALFLTGQAINLNSSLGILVVMGISVNNGIMLFEESSCLTRRSGALPLGSLYRGTISRLKPILMTSLTTVTALIPLAIDPFGNSSQTALAISIIGGLSVSTLISILILPSIIKTRLKRSFR